MLVRRRAERREADARLSGAEINLDTLFSIEIGVIIGILAFLVKRIIVIGKDIKDLRKSLFSINDLILDEDMEEDLKNRDQGILVRSAGKRKEMDR